MVPSLFTSVEPLDGCNNPTVVTFVESGTPITSLKRTGIFTGTSTKPVI